MGHLADPHWRVIDCRFDLAQPAGLGLEEGRDRIDVALHRRGGASAGDRITLRHLLTHTSGLRDWGFVEAIAGWPRTSPDTWTWKPSSS